MGVQDTSTKDYLSDADIFADAVNYYLYGGETVVKPTSLRPLDSHLLLHVFEHGDKEETYKGRDNAVERYRDVVRQWTVMTDDTCAYVIFGIEAQTNIHYGMPIRSILSDALQYAAQAEELRVLHRNAGEKESSAEFLSGMHRTDRLSPVITLCIHFGPEPWDGALSLKELFDLPNDRLLPFVQDYRVLLIEPSRMQDEDFEKFSTSLGPVLRFMKAAPDKRKLKELLKRNEAFQRLDRKAARVIRDCANVKINTETTQEVVNVCKGWEDAIEDAREEGRQEEREAAQTKIISNMIEVYREMLLPETDIRRRIMQKYALTEQDVDSYMMSQSA
ncbi:MAG: Rpn family recombination-promoting nuclease/putative transposase [Lachnospiraceae bacterium]|nr:Rpn family recombination-promoting nuclease/putative transposase [Lachnospiraceae bacterium]